MPDTDFCASGKENCDISTGYERVIEALYRNASASCLVEECQRTLQNPVQLINGAFDIVCASTLYSVDSVDDKWLKNEEVGALQQECIENLRTSKNLYKANQSDVPVHIHNKTQSNKKSDTWICRIMREGKIFGYLVVLECNRAMNEQDERLLTSFSRAISLALKIEQNESSLTSARIEKLVEKLLNTTASNPMSQDLASNLTALGRLPKENIFAITVRVTKAAAEGVSLRYYEKSLSPYLKD